MKKETKIYTEYCIRNQIAAGGSDDWQIRLGKYVISLQYVDCPGDGFLGRLASLAGRVPQRLVAVVYQRNRDGQINAIRQISVPASPLLFSLFHFDKFAAMRAGDRVRRLRGEKLRNRYTESDGHSV